VQSLHNICLSISPSGMNWVEGGRKGGGEEGKDQNGFAIFRKGSSQEWIYLAMSVLCICGAALASGKRGKEGEGEGGSEGAVTGIESAERRFEWCVVREGREGGGREGGRSVNCLMEGMRMSKTRRLSLPSPLPPSLPPSLRPDDRSRQGTPSPSRSNTE